jgi:hypothetical protein
MECMNPYCNARDEVKNAHVPSGWALVLYDGEKHPACPSCRLHFAGGISPRVLACLKDGLRRVTTSR